MQTGCLADLHTATSISAADQFGKPEVPMVVLATAHPVEFPEAVKSTSNTAPALPPHLQEIIAVDKHSSKDADAVLPSSDSSGC